MSKTKKLAKFAWKYRGEIGNVLSHSAVGYGGAKAGVSLSNYNYFEQRQLKKIQKQNNEILKTRRMSGKGRK